MVKGDNREYCHQWRDKLLLIGGGRCCLVFADGWRGWFWPMKVDFLWGAKQLPQIFDLSTALSREITGSVVNGGINCFQLEEGAVAWFWLVDGEVGFG